MQRHHFQPLANLPSCGLPPLYQSCRRAQIRRATLTRHIHSQPAAPGRVKNPAVLQQCAGAIIAAMQQQEAPLKSRQTVGTPGGRPSIAPVHCNRSLQQAMYKETFPCTLMLMYTLTAKAVCGAHTSGGPRVMHAMLWVWDLEKEQSTHKLVLEQLVQSHTYTRQRAHTFHTASHSHVVRSSRHKSARCCPWLSSPPCTHRLLLRITAAWLRRGLGPPSNKQARYGTEQHVSRLSPIQICQQVEL